MLRGVRELIGGPRAGDIHGFFSGVITKLPAKHEDESWSYCVTRLPT